MKHRLFNVLRNNWPTMLTIIGMCLLLNAIWLPVKAWLSQQLIAHSWRQTLMTNEQLAPWPWADTYPIAQMSVPRLNQRLVLLRGVDPTSLAFSAGVMHQYAEMRPFEPIVVAGHRDTHFAFLEDIKMKDIISLMDKTGKNRLYQVEELLIIDSRENQLNIDSSEANLVLITCYPFDSLSAGGSLRYVVKAKLL